MGSQFTVQKTSSSKQPQLEVNAVKADSLPLSGMTVIVNPGHNVKLRDGTFDRGMHGKLGKDVIYEYTLNDKVAENVKRKFEQLGANVIYVEKTLKDSIQAKENKIKPDLFIAIHHDAKGDGKHAPTNGETVYCWGRSQKVGKYINDEFKKDLTIKNIPNSPNYAKELCVLKADSSINAVLVEVGFVTNPKELEILNSAKYQDKAAQMIVDGSKKFLVEQKAKKQKEIQAKIEQDIKQKINLFDSTKNKNINFIIPSFSNFSKQ